MYQCDKCFHQYCVSNDSLASCNVCEDGDMFSPIEESEVKNMALNNEQLIALLNSALDELLEMFGREWLIRWAIDNGLSKEEIINWIYDDEEIVAQVWKKVEEEEEE